MKISKTNLKSKKVIILASLLVIAVALTGLVLWNNYTWGQYEANTNSRYQAAKDRGVRVLTDVESADEIESLAAELDETAADLCDAPMLSNIRQSLDQNAKKYQEDCEKRKSALNEVSAAAKVMTKRLETEERVADFIKSVSSKLTAIKEGDYVGRMGVWEQAKDELSDMEVDNSYKDVLSAQVKAAEGIIKGYEGVIKADKAENRGKFDDATVDLRRAYEKFSQTAELGEASYEKLATSLRNAISRL